MPCFSVPLSLQLSPRDLSRRPRTHPRVESRQARKVEAPVWTIILRPLHRKAWHDKHRKNQHHQDRGNGCPIRRVEHPGLSSSALRMGCKVGSSRPWPSAYSQGTAVVPTLAS